MMAGLALIIIYLIILGGVRGAIILTVGVLLLFLSPGILFILALAAPSLLKKLENPLKVVIRGTKDLMKHMLRPPDR